MDAIRAYYFSMSIYVDIYDTGMDDIIDAIRA